MSFKNLQYSLETASIHFQGGVRRPLFIMMGVCFVLLIPFYLLGQVVAGFWANSEYNLDRIFYENMQNPKTTKIYNYTVGRTQRVPLRGETVLYTTINNLNNPEIGYNPLAYTIQVLDINGEIIFSERQEGFLLPNEVKYVITNPKKEEAFELRLIEEPQTNPILSNPNANNFSNILNDIDIRNQTVREIDENNLEVRAIIKNNSLIEIRKLEILYIIRGNRDRVIGIGQRTVENLLPEEEREFLARYPKARYRRARSADIRVRVNYLDVENFVI